MPIPVGLILFAALPVPPAPPAQPIPPPAQVTVGDTHLVNRGMAGVGRIPASARDNLGETFGSLSAIAFDASSWKRNADGSYTGTLYTQPDRGYNNPNTLDYHARIETVAIRFTPALAVAVTQDQVEAHPAGAIPLIEYGGESLTGLDATPTGSGVRDGFPSLPQAYNGRISLDAEGIVRLRDGSFFISDEYGPYLYKFGPDGILESATRPPAALIPRRKGVESFSSNNPDKGQPAPDPLDPESGRQNNQGLEGLSLAPDGRTLFAIMQSAARQDGGNSSSTRMHTRLLKYDIGGAQPVLEAEYVLDLPTLTVDLTEAQVAAAREKATDKNAPIATHITAVAATSEILAINDHLLLVLARDSGSGHGSATSATSGYRKILAYDLEGATNIAGSRFDSAGASVAPGGKLDPSVTPSRGVDFIDINDAAQLARFGLHNGPKDDDNNLSEKWESMALVPALDPAAPDDYFLFVGNDNDFVTQHGFQAGITYAHPSGVDTDSMLLAWRLTVMKK